MCYFSLLIFNCHYFVPGIWKANLYNLTETLKPSTTLIRRDDFFFPVFVWKANVLIANSKVHLLFCSQTLYGILPNWVILFKSVNVNIPIRLFKGHVFCYSSLASRFIIGQVTQAELLQLSMRLALRRCCDVSVGVLTALVGGLTKWGRPEKYVFGSLKLGEHEWFTCMFGGFLEAVCFVCCN